MNDIQVEGDVAPGFESLKLLFTQQMRTLAEENAQLCVYHRGKKVVDLWASAPGKEAFSGDSLVNIFSSGKSLEAIAIGALVYRLRREDYPVLAGIRRPGQGGGDRC